MSGPAAVKTTSFQQQLQSRPFVSKQCNSDLARADRIVTRCDLSSGAELIVQVMPRANVHNNGCLGEAPLIVPVLSGQ